MWNPQGITNKQIHEQPERCIIEEQLIDFTLYLSLLVTERKGHLLENLIYARHYGCFMTIISNCNNNLER